MKQAELYSELYSKYTGKKFDVSNYTNTNFKKMLETITENTLKSRVAGKVTNQTKAVFDYTDPHPNYEMRIPLNAAIFKYHQKVLKLLLTTAYKEDYEDSYIYEL